MSEIIVDQEYLWSKGFTYALFKDGMFYYIEEPHGEKANRIASIVESLHQYHGSESLMRDEVNEKVIIQCDDNYQNPIFYCDGYDWKLTDDEFKEILAKL